MGIEDLVASALGGGGGGGGNAGKLIGVVMGMVGGAGGLAGLVGQLKGGGLGDAADSWVGTGANQAVSGDQMRDALGADAVRDAAAQAGVSEEEASGGLADMLPKVIDALTPGGSMPSGDQLSGLLGGLKGLLK